MIKEMGVSINYFLLCIYSLCWILAPLMNYRGRLGRVVSLPRKCSCSHLKHYCIHRQQFHTGKLCPLSTPPLIECARDKSQHTREWKLSTDYRSPGKETVFFATRSLPKAGSPLRATGLILVAQMFCSGRWHTDPLVSWSAGIYCILEESTEKRDGAHSYKCLFSVKSPSTIKKNIYIYSHHLTSRETEERTGTDASLNLTP